MAMEVESQKEVFIYFFISLLGRRVMWYTFDLEKKKKAAMWSDRLKCT